MSKEKPAILEREEINLTQSQNKMIASGWGEEVLNNTVTEKIFYSSGGLKVRGYISYPKDKSKNILALSGTVEELATKVLLIPLLQEEFLDSSQAGDT